MSGKAILGATGAPLESALADRVAEVRREDPFSPLTVVVGSNILAAHLRRVLAERAGGLFNVRFATFADLASLVACESGLACGATAPPFADRVIVGELVSSGKIAAALGESAKTRGFAEVLIATFSDLAEAGCAPREAASVLGNPGAKARLGEKAALTLSLYTDFRERMEALGGDVHTRFAAALACPLGESLGKHILAYGFYDFNEMQRRLLMRLARERDVTLFMPWGEGDSYRFAARSRAMLEQRGFGPFVPVSRSAASSKRTVRPRLRNLPGEEEEVREIVRSVLALAAKGVRFGDVAVALPAVGSYASLVREAFGEAGVPCYFPAGAANALGAAARGALGLLGLLGGAMERRELVEFLASIPAPGRETERTAPDHFSLWMRESAEAGVVGERGWLEESAAFVERTRREAESGGKGRRGALAAAIEVDSVIGSIVRAGAAMRRDAGWAERAGVFSTLVGELFPPSEERDAARGAVEALAALDRLGTRAPFEVFSRIAEAAVAGEGGVAGRPGGEGVNVLSLSQARALSFAAVFIPGLAERIFPSPISQDPFLGDRDRRELNAVSRGAVVLAEKSERLDEEALLFALARESARDELVCSYPRFEEGTGRTRIPSSFLRYIDGLSKGGSRGAELEEETVPRGAPLARGAEPLSVHEFDFERAREYRDGAGALPESSFFSRGARLVRERWGERTFTAYDGVFSSREALDALRSSFGGPERRFAPTSLEAYAGCPFSYFLTQVLEIEVLEEPERVISIDPRDRGSLVHTILARLYGELKERGLLPVSGAPAGEVFAIADAVISRFLEEFPATGSVGLPVFWETEKRIVREAIRLFLEEERLETGEFVPEHFERSFGRKQDGLDVPFECGGRTVLFRGRIDRIDTAPGGRFRVIDYKTGKLADRDQDFKRGSALQLPVYLVGASRILGLDLRAGEAQYRRVWTGEGKRSVSFSGGAWDEGAGLFAKIVETITRGIEGGVFFAPADDQGCRLCDLKIACPAGMSRLFGIKAANDGRARPYVEMRGEGEGAE